MPSVLLEVPSIRYRDRFQKYKRYVICVKGRQGKIVMGGYIPIWMNN